MSNTLFRDDIESDPPAPTAGTGTFGTADLNRLIDTMQKGRRDAEPATPADTG